MEFHPFSRPDPEADPRVILINPKIAFGRPVIRDSGVPTAMLDAGFNAGDSLEVLAEDYGIGRSEIEEALRYELRPAA